MRVQVLGFTMVQELLHQHPCSPHAASGVRQGTAAVQMAAKGAEQSPDNVTLKLILVSGRTAEFSFAPSATAHDVIARVFTNWPQEWEGEHVESASMLKLIYHGRFLHGSVTLQALQLPQGKTTVMHMVTRENLPEPNSNDSLSKRKRGGCCRCVLS